MRLSFIYQVITTFLLCSCISMENDKMDFNGQKLFVEFAKSSTNEVCLDKSYSLFFNEDIPPCCDTLNDIGASSKKLVIFKYDIVNKKARIKLCLLTNRGTYFKPKIIKTIRNDVYIDFTGLTLSKKNNHRLAYNLIEVYFSGVTSGSKTRFLHQLDEESE